jgi:hypothetical protein
VREQMDPTPENLGYLLEHLSDYAELGHTPFAYMPFVERDIALLGLADTGEVRGLMLSTYLENLLVTGLAQSKEDTVQAQQWAALNLRHVELRPIKAIARVLSVSPRSVSRLLSRGLHLVARELVRQLKKHADEASRSSP